MIHVKIKFGNYIVELQHEEIDTVLKFLHTVYKQMGYFQLTNAYKVMNRIKWLTNSVESMKKNAYPIDVKYSHIFLFRYYETLWGNHAKYDFFFRTYFDF